eukprot:579545-Amphidinium_carterae.1
MRAWLRSENPEFTPVRKGEEFCGDCAQLLWTVGEHHALLVQVAGQPSSSTDEPADLEPQ